MLDAGGADTYTQRAIPGPEPDLDSGTLRPLRSAPISLSGAVSFGTGPAMPIGPARIIHLCDQRSTHVGWDAQLVSDQIRYLIGYPAQVIDAAELLERVRVSSGLTQEE